MSTGSYDKDTYEKCAKYTPCDDKYDCTSGMVCLVSETCQGPGDHITGVCRPPPTCDGDCSSYQSPDKSPVECKSMECVQEGTSQAVSVQIIWIVLFGLIFLAVGKIAQQYFKSGISFGLMFPMFTYIPLVVMYMSAMGIKYKEWAQINPNFTFMNSTETPFLYGGGD